MEERARRKVAQWIESFGFGEAARRAYRAGGSEEWRRALLAEVRRREG